MMKTTHYELVHKETGLSASHFHEDLTDNQNHEITDHVIGRATWKTQDLYNARFVLLNSTPWYNADADTPEHNDFDSSNHRIIKVVTTREIEDIDSMSKSEYYTLMAEFIRHEYSKPEYHNSTKTVEEMVEDYTVNRRLRVDRFMYKKFDEFVKKCRQ